MHTRGTCTDLFVHVNSRDEFSQRPAIPQVTIGGSFVSGFDSRLGQASVFTFNVIVSHYNMILNPVFFFSRMASLQ